MSNKLQQISPLKTSEPKAYRIISFRADTLNDEERSVEVTLATESGVDVYDGLRGVIKEHLVMDGGKIPKQVPLVDSHNHDSVRNILGSIRNLRIDGGNLKGTAYFGAKPAAAEAYADMKDGHLTDISVGFFRLKERYIEPDKTDTVGGRAIKGPARIVTRWAPFEGSAVTVGADRHSTFGSVPALRCYLDPESMRTEHMEASYRELLIGLGMPSTHTDEEALAWAKENVTKKEERAAVVAPPAVAAVATQVTPDKSTPDTAAIESARRAETARVQSIRKNVRLAGLPETFADKLIDDAIESGVAAERILQEKIKVNESSLGITPSGAGRAESFRKATLEAMSARMTQTAWQRPQACEDFRNMPFLELAKRCLAEEGVELRGLSPRDIARRALMLGTSTRSSDGQAYHTTGNFANLLLDATNKTLLKSFENTASTYQAWVRMAGTVKDFKSIHRKRLGEVGNLPVVPENGTYQELVLSDAGESYKVDKYGGIVSLTWETIVNDDLNAFSRLVQLEGSAAKRTINKSVYDLLFSNPVLSDGIATFHASSHGANLVTTDFSADGLSAGYKVMMLQTGINSDVILGTMPRFLLHGVTDSVAVNVLLRSVSDVNESAGNSGTINLYGPTGPRRLIPIMEPLIENNDPDSWYLAADSNEIDTFELTFLEGEESPVFEQETAFIQDAVKYKVRQTFGVGCIDYRGLYKSAGNG